MSPFVLSFDLIWQTQPGGNSAAVFGILVWIVSVNHTRQNILVIGMADTTGVIVCPWSNLWDSLCIYPSYDWAIL